MPDRLQAPSIAPARPGVNFPIDLTGAIAECCAEGSVDVAKAAHGVCPHLVLSRCVCREFPVRDWRKDVVPDFSSVIWPLLYGYAHLPTVIRREAAFHESLAQ